MDSEFQAAVDAHIARLINTPYHRIEADVAEKRRTWVEREYGAPQPGQRSPREAYEILLLKYLSLSEEQVPIISETDDTIVWHSYNDCSTLEACNRLALDPRIVCRRIYEKSTQAFISQLDPHLRFWRSYDEIRPHSERCKEGITRLSFEQIMRLAITEAHKSRSSGNKGYGAVVVMDGDIVARTHDTCVTHKDPSLHAELNAIRSAADSLGTTDLCGAILFSPCEPCPMCSSLAVWANITAIVFGASIEETAKLGRQRIGVGCREIVARGPAFIEVFDGVLRHECLALYE